MNGNETEEEHEEEAEEETIEKRKKKKEEDARSTSPLAHDAKRWETVDQVCFAHPRRSIS